MANPPNNDDTPEFSDAELDYFASHMDEVRAEGSEVRLLSWSLGTALVFGLIAHIVGYLLRGDPTLGLVSDLVYALGYALWTGAVVAFFVELFPRIKARQIRGAVDAYERALAERRRTRRA